MILTCKNCKYFKGKPEKEFIIYKCVNNKSKLYKLQVHKNTEACYYIRTK